MSDMHCNVTISHNGRFHSFTSTDAFQKVMAESNAERREVVQRILLHYQIATNL
jgi:hypothetical protein